MDGPVEPAGRARNLGRASVRRGVLVSDAAGLRRRSQGGGPDPSRHAGPPPVPGWAPPAAGGRIRSDCQRPGQAGAGEGGGLAPHGSVDIASAPGASPPWGRRPPPRRPQGTGPGLESLHGSHRAGPRTEPGSGPPLRPARRVAGAGDELFSLCAGLARPRRALQSAASVAALQGSGPSRSVRGAGRRPSDDAGGRLRRVGSIFPSRGSGGKDGRMDGGRGGWGGGGPNRRPEGPPRRRVRWRVRRRRSENGRGLGGGQDGWMDGGGRVCVRGIVSNHRPIKIV